MRQIQYFAVVLLLLVAFGKEGKSQCSITASAAPTTLPCGGGSVTLTASGSGFATVLLDNDFDAGNAGTGWNVSPAATFTNPCDASFDGGTYMWMGDATAAPRTLETVPMDVTCGGDICFYLDFSIQAAASPCEGPDLVGEGVYFEYSVNGGTTWTTIFYFQPNTGTGAYTTWAQHCFTIPAAAQTGATIFQWYQGGSSGNAFDHWGIDNVTITAQGCGTAWLDWDNIPGTVGPVGDPASQTLNITSTTTFNVCYTDGGGFSCCQSVTVTVQGATITATPSATDVSCFGICDGTVSATASGGSAPYTYNWTSLGSGQSHTSVCAGTYTVTITDANGCIGTASVDVLQPNAIDLFAIPLDETCGGLCDGVLFASVTGGLAPFTYTWNNGIGGGQSPSGVCPGTYTVTVVDANGCIEQNTFSSTTTINAGAAASSGFTYNGNQCVSGNSYVFTNTGSSGATYSWNFGDANTSTAESPTHVYAAPGTYTVTQIVTNGSCSQTSILTVVVYAAPGGAITGLDISCAGNCDGAANLSPTGGTSPYTFSWSNGASTEDLSGLCIGTYTVTISDAGSCTGTASTTVGTPSTLSVGVSGTNIPCSGSCTGTALAAPSGGTSPFTYSWDDPGFQNTATATGLCAGTFNVTLTDAGGCSVSGSYTVTAPSPMVLNTSVVDATCGASDGEVSVLVSGGATPFTYLWNNGCSSSSCTGLASGTYLLFVTDGNGCTALGNASVSDAGGAGIASATVDNNLACAGVCTGQATASITGATPPITYLWSDPLAQATAVATGLCAGSFNVSITDASGCASIASVTITEPSVLNAVVTASTDALCFGVCNGSATVSVSGGVGPYTYSWSNAGASTGATTGLDLCAGTMYTASITDASGCTTSAAISVGEPTAVATSIIGSDALCNGGNSGSADLTPSGGTAPYNYVWSTTDVTQDLSNLAAGIYTVTVSDLYSCSATDVVVIGEPTALTLGTSTNDASCALANGSACVTPSGGTGLYTYAWNDSLNQTTTCAATLAGGSYSITVSDNNGCSDVTNVTINDIPGGNALATLVSNATGALPCDGEATATLTSGTTPFTYVWDDPGAQTTAAATGLCQGNYCVTVTDAMGCYSSDCITITAPPGIATLTAGVDLLCNGLCNGTATITVAGGIAPYTYNWTSGFTTQNIAGLCAGTYYVTVTDANTISVVDSIEILEPQVLGLTTSGTDALCLNACDGSATVTVSGGTGSMTYLWDTPTAQTTATVYGLCAGTYNVTATDANSCSTTSSYIVSEPPAILVIVTNVDANCGQADGSVTASVTNGTAPFTYQWSTACTGSSCTGLMAGTFNVTVTDSVGCTGIGMGAVGDLNGPVAVIDSSIDASCFGVSDGQATVVVNDGTPPYTYSWNTSPLETGATATALPAGATIVTVTDANGCVTAVTVQIGEPTPVVVSIASGDPNCSGACDGYAAVTASGGTGLYTYLWNDPMTQTTMSALSICAGAFEVSVEDANGCTVMGSVTLTDPAVLVLSVNPSDVFCGGSCDGSAIATPFGGTLPYSYSWNTSPVQTTQIADSLCATTHTITVTDSNGCTASSAAVINEPTPLVVQMSAASDVSCAGVCDGYAQSFVTGGLAPYTYLWSTSSSMDQVTNLCVGIYDLTVTDVNGCQKIVAVIISSPPAMLGNVSLQNVTCNALCDGVASVAVSGGTVPYTYLWDDTYLQNTFSADSLCAGAFTVVITDGNNCSITRNVNISEPQPLTFVADSVSSTCGDQNGSACVAVVGGLVPYTITWNDPFATVGTCVDSVYSGVYNPLLEDGNGCFYQAAVIINDISGPIIDSVSTTDVTCSGDANGTALVNFTGGTAPLTYIWKDGSGGVIGMGSSFLSGMSGGAYTITIVDFNGCTVSQTFSVFEPNPIVSAITGSTDISCFGACDGTANLMALNGTPPLTYTWLPSLSNVPNATSLCGGMNNVLIVDANGCQKTDGVYLAEPVDLSIGLVASNVSCNGDNDGQITVSPSGGTQPYTYQWLPTGSGTMATSLTAGSYTVIVTDNNQCNTMQATTITEPQTLFVNGATAPSTCGDANGSASVAPIGGTGAYTYAWYDEFGAPLGQYSDTASGLSQGLYAAVTSDANGCVDTLSPISIGNTAGVVIQNITPTPVSCNGFSDGAANVFPIGPIYNYVWSNGASGASPTGLAAGSYTVTLTDLNGCVDITSVTVTEPDVLYLVMSNDTDICIGGDANIGVLALGGSDGAGEPGMDYVYNWDNGVPDGDAHIVSPGSDITYNVTVTDVNGCVEVGAVTVSLYDPIVVVVSDDAICDGQSVVLTAVVTGGNPTNNIYDYDWSDGNSTSTISVSPSAQTSYTVSVDDQGCSPSAYTSATVSVNPPPLANFIWNCNANPFVLTFSSTSTPPPGVALSSLNWDFGDGGTGSDSTLEHVYTSSQGYTVTLEVTTVDGCKASKTYTQVQSPPTAGFVIMQNGTILFPPVTSILSPVIDFVDSSSSDVVWWTWDYEDGDYDTVQTPDFNSGDTIPHTYTVADDYNVLLWVRNSTGCYDTVSHPLVVEKEFVLFTPNSFSPNGDGVNDFFFPQGIGIEDKTFSFYVFDRWGDMVYESEGVFTGVVGWDGTVNNGQKVSQLDVYVWLIRTEDQNGNAHEYVGHVTLVR